jgi:hypothetical protein
MDNIQENLRNLGVTILEMVDNLPNSSIFKFKYIYHITTTFEYNGKVSWEEHQIEKIDEGSITIRIHKDILDSIEFKEAKKSVDNFIKSYMNTSDIVKQAVDNNLSSTSHLSNSFLESFMKKVVKIILESSDNDLELIDLRIVYREIEELINCSMRELRGKPLRCELTINLTGIILKSKKININEYVQLRKPEKKDCDIKIDDPFYIRPRFVAPSAILVIKGFEWLNRSLNIEHYIKYYLAVLRLFKRGNINFIGFNFISDAILNERFAQNHQILQNQQIDQRMINNFSYMMDNYILEKNLYGPLKNFINDGIDFNKMFFDDFLHLKIAYEHYCTALLLYNSNFEKRIVETIIGLEALFVKRSDREGGSYKIKINISRLFDSLLMNETEIAQKLLNISYDPKKVLNRITDGFRVRNKYAHGEHISQEMLTEFNNNHGGLDKLLNYLIDYLRISIILMIINEKEDLLDLINASLIKNECNKELNKKFPDIKLFMLLNNIDDNI